MQAVDLVVPGLPLALKWPNDLLLADGKLAGVLLERSGDRVVAGFGVNLAAAPEVPGRKTASLDGSISPHAFAPLLAGSFSRLVTSWRTNPPEWVAGQWLERAHAIGSALIVHLGPDERVEGRFEGIEPDGALRLGTDRGIEIIRAGDLTLL